MQEYSITRYRDEITEAVFRLPANIQFGRCNQVVWEESTRSCTKFTCASVVVMKKFIENKLLTKNFPLLTQKEKAQSGNQRNHLLGPAAPPPEHVVSSFTLNESASVLELQRPAKGKK